MLAVAEALGMMFPTVPLTWLGVKPDRTTVSSTKPSKLIVYPLIRASTKGQSVACLRFYVALGSTQKEVSEPK